MAPYNEIRIHDYPNILLERKEWIHKSQQGFDGFWPNDNHSVLSEIIYITSYMMLW